MLTEAFCQPSEFLKLTAMDPRYSAVVSMSSTVFYKGGDIPRSMKGKPFVPDVIAIPLKMDDFIRVGLIRRAGISLAPAGATFVRI